MTQPYPTQWQAPAYATAAQRWQAVVDRDAGADGHFVVAVKTTGIYGSPSASSRLPRRQNVEFFDTAEQARAAGYRPSRRVGGDRQAVFARQARVVAQVCDAIAAATQVPTLQDLAARVGMSPFHLHRVFKAHTGLTPKAYVAALRARRLRDGLAQPATSVTEAIYGSGFNSNSGFYEHVDRLLGMSASAYRAGGLDAEIVFAVAQCSLGAILVASSQRGICAIFLGDDPEVLVRDLQDQFPRARLRGADSDFERLVATVIAHVEAPGLGLTLPLDVRGTAFQQRVWQALQAVPPGTTVSYGELAASLGAPAAVRAVARACAANRLAVVIPCHRIVRRDGDLAGYRWGVERKRELLEREASFSTQAGSTGD